MNVDELLAEREREHALINSAVGLLRQLGGMMPGTREVVDTVVDLLTSITEDD